MVLPFSNTMMTISDFDPQFCHFLSAFYHNWLARRMLVKLYNIYYWNNIILFLLIIYVSLTVSVKTSNSIAITAYSIFHYLTNDNSPSGERCWSLIVDTVWLLHRSDYVVMGYHLHRICEPIIIINPWSVLLWWWWLCRTVPYPAEVSYPYHPTNVSSHCVH